MDEEWKKQGEYNIYKSEVLSCEKSSNRNSIVIKAGESKNKSAYYQPEDMEQLMLRLGYMSYINGEFKEAVKYFQRKNGLTADGIVGNKTLKALGMSASSSSSSSSSSSASGYSEADINLLTRLIYGEARGESYVGQVAVGAVVMNRIRSASFPNTMSGVIYQRYAFTAVDDGQINLTPNATARKAALDAINGWDPSGGCIYFYNPATSTSKWIWSRPIVKKIGKHNFAK
jgi:N-acetylmuramoyl-L-alanine amidase